MNLFRQSQRPQIRQQVREIRTPKIGKRRITNLRTSHPIIQLAIQMRGDMSTGWDAGSSPAGHGRGVRASF